MAIKVAMRPGEVVVECDLPGLVASSAESSAMATRSRLGLFAWLAVAFNSLIALWDWWSRTTGLDPYFGAQRDTFWGHTLSALLTPWWLLIAAVVFGLAWCFAPKPLARETIGESDLNATLSAVRRERDSAKKERDDALERVKELEISKWPQLKGYVLQIQAQDPSVGNDLFVALVMSISNDGAPTTILDFTVWVNKVNGIAVTVDVNNPPNYWLQTGKGRSVIPYEKEHYIIIRTRENMIVRGKPVSGILPCIFRNTKSLDEIDVRTLKVKFKDGTGDESGASKWWATQKAESANSSDDAPMRTIHGLPPPQPFASSPSHGAVAKLSDELNVPKLSVDTKLEGRGD
jgi:hypothetical protein